MQLAPRPVRRRQRAEKIGDAGLALVLRQQTALVEQRVEARLRRRALPVRRGQLPQELRALLQAELLPRLDVLSRELELL